MFKVFRMFLIALSIAAPIAASGQSHPSGLSNRVLIAVQNPTGSQSGNSVIVPQFSLQIADATNNGFPTAAPPLISGWGTSMPASIENLAGQAAGLVQNEDGTASLLNFSSEGVTSSNIGVTGVAVSTLLTQDLNYVFAADGHSGRLTIVDRGNGNAVFNLNLPGISNVSTTPGGAVVLVFATDSSTVYFVRHLSATNQQAYANGQWPANARDCEPYNLPTFCLIAAASPGTSVATYSQANFDHPVKAVTSATGDVMYVLNGGPEADGQTASVTVLPVAPLLFADGSQSGSLPANLTNYPVIGGADNAVAAGSILYVAGQGRISAGRWGGQLTKIDTSNGQVSQPMPMADGYPARMTLADDNTLWIGSIRCNTGSNQYYAALQSSAQGGCLTVVNLVTGSVAYVEPWLCTVDSNSSCGATDHPANYLYQGGGSGDVTGIAPITGQHKVFYVEHGQVHIRQTTSPYSIIPNNGTTVAGVAVDVVYMDAGSDNDGTSTSTTH